MSNPLFGMMGQNNIMQRFQQFAQMFRGDPRQQIQQMMQTGRISQDQYNRAVQMAQQFRGMMGK